MSEQEVERFHGKHRTYSVVKVDGGVFGSSKYYVKVSNGETRSFSSLRDAVEWARKEAQKS